MEYEVTKPICLNCLLNMNDICGGVFKRKDNGQEAYGSSVKEMLKLYPEECPDFDIDFEGLNNEIEHKKVEWNERMKLLPSYTNFKKTIMSGKEIVETFKDAYERYGPRYKYIRKNNIDVKKKFNLIDEKQYVVYTKDKFYSGPFCGIFSLKEEFVGFFGYKKAG